MFQVDVPRGFLPVGLVRNVVQIAQSIPLGFRGQADGFAGPPCQPVTERFGLKVIHLDRPIPRHVDDLCHRS